MVPCLIRLPPQQLRLKSFKMLIVLSTSALSWKSLEVQVPPIFNMYVDFLVSNHIFLTSFFFLPSPVPAVYPFDMYARLSMVDSLQRLGIDRHFKEEIRSVLDEAYK